MGSLFLLLLIFEENNSSILMVPHDSRILLKNLSLYFDI